MTSHTSTQLLPALHHSRFRITPHTSIQHYSACTCIFRIIDTSAFAPIPSTAVQASCCAFSLNHHHRNTHYHDILIPHDFVHIDLTVICFAPFVILHHTTYTYTTIFALYLLLSTSSTLLHLLHYHLLPFEQHAVLSRLTTVTTHTIILCATYTVHNTSIHSCDHQGRQARWFSTIV